MAFLAGRFAAVGGVGFGLASASRPTAQALPATFGAGGLPWADLHVLFLLSAQVALLASRIDEPDAGSVLALTGSVGPNQSDRH